jgi:hypothetical protein
MNDTRHGSSEGRKTHGKVEPKAQAKPQKPNPGPKGQGQLNEGDARWSGDPKKVD